MARIALYSATKHLDRRITLGPTPTNDTTLQTTKQSPSRAFTSAWPTPKWIANHRLHSHHR